MSKPKPVTIPRDGSTPAVTYPSKSACAKAKGVSVRAVTKAIENGTLTTLGLGRKIAIEIDGKLYESLAEAGRAKGKSRQAMWALLNKQLGSF